MKTISQVFIDDDLRTSCVHIQELYGDFQKLFMDLIDLNMPDRVKNPFLCKPEEQKIDLQETVIELQCDEEAKMIFENSGLCEMWLHCSVKFPSVWNEAKLLVIAFPSSYLVEKGFCEVNQILTKTRNRLDIKQSGDLRLFCQIWNQIF